MILTTLLLLINMSRVTPVKTSVVLTNIAQVRATYLCTHDFSHEGWKQYDSSFKYRGENLAKGFVTATSVNKAFLKSPTHKDVIINPRYTHVGIATACDITVEEFGGY